MEIIKIVVDSSEEAEALKKLLRSMILTQISRGAALHFLR